MSARAITVTLTLAQVDALLAATVDADTYDEDRDDSGTMTRKDRARRRARDDAAHRLRVARDSG